MKAMSKFWMALVVGVAMGVSLFWATPAKAVDLSNTAITWAQFMSWVNDADANGVPDYDPLYPPETVPFDFAGTIFPDGFVFTAVYPGAGTAAGKWVYVYQVQLLSPSDIAGLNGMSWIWIENPSLAGVGGVTSFKITSGSPTIGFGLGSVDITDADWLPHPVNPTADFDFSPGPGETTYIFGLFSTLPPTKIDATLRDSVSQTLRPLIYTPSPEPSAFLLLGLGLMGVTIWRRRRL